MGIAEKDAVGKSFFDVFEKNKTTTKAVRVYLNVMKTTRCTSVGKLPKVVSGEGKISFNSCRRNRIRNP